MNTDCASSVCKILTGGVHLSSTPQHKWSWVRHRLFNTELLLIIVFFTSMILIAKIIICRMMNNSAKYLLFYVEFCLVLPFTYFICFEMKFSMKGRKSFAINANFLCHLMFCKNYQTSNKILSIESGALFLVSSKCLNLIFFVSQTDCDDALH